MKLYNMSTQQFLYYNITVNDVVFLGKTMVVIERASGKRYAQCNVSIDADLREQAREKKINLSALLTEAIKAKIDVGNTEAL